MPSTTPLATPADTAAYLAPLIEEAAALARAAGMWRTSRLLKAAARSAQRETTLTQRPS